MGLLGILIGLGLLVWLAYRGWSVLLLAPAAALVAAAFSGEPMLAHWTQTFMGGAAAFLALVIAAVPTARRHGEHEDNDSRCSQDPPEKPQWNLPCVPVVLRAEQTGGFPAGPDLELGVERHLDSHVGQGPAGHCARDTADDFLAVQDLFPRLGRVNLEHAK